MWIISFTLMFVSVLLMGFAYSYFTSLKNQQKNLDFAVISLGFSNSTAVTVKQNSVTISSSAVVPGCEIAVNGRVNNTGDCGIYTVLGVNVSFTGYEDMAYYNLSGTKLVLNNNDEFSTASTYIAPSGYADFSNVSYMLDENIGDEAQGEQISVTVTAYGIQSNYIPTESPAVKATNLMVNPYFQRRSATIVVGDQTITITDNVKTVQEFVNQTSFTEENSCGWFTDAECTQVANLNGGYDSNTTLYTKSATITLDNDENANNNVAISGDEVTVTGIGLSTATEVVIPASVTISGDTYTVTSVANDAFKNNKTITSVTLPSTIEEIGNNAFQGCTKLTSISIPETVTQIGEYAFASSGIQEIDWENMSDDEIEQSLFYQCTGLTSITIPASVETIGEHAFFYCIHLSSLTFEENSQLKTIKSYAFDYCYSLTSVILPEGLETIEGLAFAACRNIRTLHIPSTVTSIGGGIVRSAKSLRYITVHENNPVYYDEGNCVLRKSDKKLVLGSINATIPSDCIGILDRAFQGMAIKNVTIPTSCVSISSEAFRGAELTSITIQSSSLSCGYGFDNCNSLQTVIIESLSVYSGVSASNTYGCLFAYATTIRVLSSIDDGSNSYLNNNFTKTTDGDYSVYTKN